MSAQCLMLINSTDHLCELVGVETMAPVRRRLQAAEVLLVRAEPSQRIDMCACTCVRPTCHGTHGKGDAHLRGAVVGEATDVGGDKVDTCTTGDTCISQCISKGL